MKKKIIGLFAGLMLMASLVACEGETDAKVVGENIDVAAEQFEINRRVVAQNMITGDYIWEITGRCNLEYKDSKGVKRAIVDCKVSEGDGPDDYKRNSVTIADNIVVASETLEPMKASAYHYRVVYKPQTIVPDVDFKGSTKDTPKLD